MPQHHVQDLLSPFTAIRRADHSGEHWSARDLMPLLGYGGDWRNFAAAVERASIACRNSGHAPADHFVGVTENSRELGGRPRADYRLTRYAAYLVAMNGDPRKPEIAAAQTYFAARTRQAETASVPSTPPVPRSFAEALQLAADQARQLEDQAQQLAVVTPSAEAWDHLASGAGDYSVADAAKILSQHPVLQLGERRLFTVLDDLGWIFRQRGDHRWRVYQRAVDASWLSELPTSHYHPRTGELVIDPPQVRVTVKGLEALQTRLTAGQLQLTR